MRKEFFGGEEACPEHQGGRYHQIQRAKCHDLIWIVSAASQR
jgi:hypothetical protein